MLRNLEHSYRHWRLQANTGPLSRRQHRPSRLATYALHEKCGPSKPTSATGRSRCRVPLPHRLGMTGFRSPNRLGLRRTRAWGGRRGPPRRPLRPNHTYPCRRLGGPGRHQATAAHGTFPRRPPKRVRPSLPRRNRRAGAFRPFLLQRARVRRPRPRSGRQTPTPRLRHRPPPRVTTHGACPHCPLPRDRRTLRPHPALPIPGRPAIPLRFPRRGRALPRLTTSGRISWCASQRAQASPPRY